MVCGEAEGLEHLVAGVVGCAGRWIDVDLRSSLFNKLVKRFSNAW